MKTGVIILLSLIIAGGLGYALIVFWQFTFRG